MKAASSAFDVDVPLWAPGILITVAVGLVLLGGIQRIASVAEKLVPAMIVIYLVAGLSYMAIHFAQIPAVLGLIFERAFTPMAALGGFVGVSVANAIAAGISRGVLSNEAGMGSAPLPTVSPRSNIRRSRV